MLRPKPVDRLTIGIILAVYEDPIRLKSPELGGIKVTAKEG